MNSLKQIAENILSDIMNDVPVANVLLKAKIFATKKGDQELLNWLNQEINGYEENLPSYRKLTSDVKIDIHRGFQMVSNFPYPIEMIKDKAIQERLRIFLYIIQSLKWKNYVKVILILSIWIFL